MPGEYHIVPKSLTFRYIITVKCLTITTKNEQYVRANKRANETTEKIQDNQVELRQLRYGIKTDHLYCLVMLY